MSEGRKEGRGGVREGRREGKSDKCLGLPRTFLVVLHIKNEVSSTREGRRKGEGEKSVQETSLSPFVAR